ncbi:MAG: hypothetical protein ABT940_03650 [Alphaproteobacteria bacterium]
MSDGIEETDYRRQAMSELTRPTYDELEQALIVEHNTNAALRAKVEALRRELNIANEYLAKTHGIEDNLQSSIDENELLQAQLATLTAENNRLREAAKDVVDSFEMDYMIDGVIVDRPQGQCGRLYRVCKAALRGEGG